MDTPIKKQNQLYYGDNLDVLRKYIKNETVDLCYIDPPFNSKRNYNQIYNNIGKEDVAQAQAFIDTWTWDTVAENGLKEILTNYNGVFTKQSIELLSGLSKVLGKGSLFAYLVSMSLRVAEIYRVLKPMGSFYFHCDPTASHYLKIVIDSIFCAQTGEYQNEIIWKRTSGHSDSSTCGNSHDVIFFYTKSDNYTWNEVYQKYEDGYIESHYRRMDEDGRRWTDGDLTAKGLSGGGYTYEYKGFTSLWRCPIETMQKLEAAGKLHFTKSGGIRLKRYLDEMPGMQLQDTWTDISPINSQAAERLGYPTQKPMKLLERIIRASSNEGDTILDAFCGCGTTISVAHELHRNWIGIDITYQSISLILKRLDDTYGEGTTDAIQLNGIPGDLESAIALAHKKDDRTRKEFEKWAVLTYSKNKAIINEKKGADKGIDGIAMILEGSDKTRPIIFSVKSGGVTVPMIRDLHGVIDREEAAMGIFITLEHPTKPMIEEAKIAGQYINPLTNQTYDRIKIVTAQDIINKQYLNIPTMRETVKSAKPKARENQKKLAL